MFSSDPQEALRGSHKGCRKTRSAGPDVSDIGRLIPFGLLCCPRVRPPHPHLPTISLHFQDPTCRGMENDLPGDSLAALARGSYSRCSGMSNCVLSIYAHVSTTDPDRCFILFFRDRRTK
ncbi:hypothetical protein MPH_10347 [Macrophomina phaseolina MS6]|uniref:Uncharacterized protein n=1 Tax=Macrophomina phaseolina (strain MS6) TaxID=1126212 RepID=K2RIA9_MACPH|nr:hypothetical protein MPH_10347 [Macrophomina phaseolina MS6]